MPKPSEHREVTRREYFEILMRDIDDYEFYSVMIALMHTKEILFEIQLRLNMERDQ